MDTSHPKGLVASAFSRYMRQILKEKILTVTTNRIRLGQKETILALPSRDLAMREFRQEFRLLVILEVRVCLWEINLEAADGCSSSDLTICASIGCAEVTS